MGKHSLIKTVEDNKNVVGPVADAFRRAVEGLRK